MASIRNDFVFAACQRAYALADVSASSDIEEVHKSRKQTILADESLTEDEKSYTIKLLDKDNDFYKLLYNEGTKRICENCQNECLATLYCEHCVRNYLKAKFSKWTSANSENSTGTSASGRKCWTVWGANRHG